MLDLCVPKQISQNYFDEFTLITCVIKLTKQQLMRKSVRKIQQKVFIKREDYATNKEFKINNLSLRYPVVSTQFPKEFIFKEAEIRKKVSLFF